MTEADSTKLSWDATDPLSGRGAGRFNLIPFDDVKLDTGGAWLVKGMIPRDGLVVIWGAPKCGKSFWTHDLVMHVAMGWAYRGRRVAKGPVVYVACEGGNGLRARIEAWRHEHTDAYEYIVPFWLLPTPLSLIDDWADLAQSIRGAVGFVPPVCIVVDTLNRSLAGSENSDEDMSAYIQAADKLRESFPGCTIIIVHHCGHEATRPRGHTSLIGALDTQIAVKRMGDGLIATEVEKMKDGPEGATTTSRLRVVEVGTDADGDAITSCVVEPADDESPTSAPPSLTARQKRAMDVLHNVLADQGKPAPDATHYPPGATVASVEAWRQQLFAAGVLDNEAANPRQDFKRLREGLEDRGTIRQWNGLLWKVSDEG